MKDEAVAVASPAKEPQPEVVSRSGRKIKPKRYLDGEEEEPAVAPSPAKKRATSTTKIEKVAPTAVAPTVAAAPAKKPNPFGMDGFLKLTLKLGFDCFLLL